MIHQVLPVGMLRCNCSVLGDEATGEAIVVDPGADIPAILAILLKHSLRVKQILITHAHIDHIAGAQELKRITGAPIQYNQLDLPLVALMDVQAAWLGIATPEVQPPDDDLADGSTFNVGPVAGVVHHTPGHTQGSVSLYLPQAGLLLAGDTLFAGTVGRTDLPGGNPEQLVQSIRERLLSLPDATIVIAGHGESTTVGDERAFNPYLR